MGRVPVVISPRSISRALKSIGSSKKVAHGVAKERNADLRDHYLYNLSAFQSWQLVFVDESGCDKRIGFRRTGWSPLDVAHVQVARFHRDRRYQILPAYTQDDILLSHVYQGSTDSSVFEDFIEQLLTHCGRWPEPNSVLVMDNASFHRRSAWHSYALMQVSSLFTCRLIHQISIQSRNTFQC